MEPADLKNDPPDDAQLEAWLRRNAASTPLTDAGFTSRVLAALPPSAAVRSNVRRRVFCLAGALAGLALTGLLGGDWSRTPENIALVVQPFTLALDQLSNPPTAWALALAAFSVVYALRRTLRPLARI